jgi:hypothetical protein
MDFKGIGCDGVDWIQLLSDEVLSGCQPADVVRFMYMDMAQWRAFVNTVIGPSGFIKEFLDLLNNHQLLKDDSVSWSWLL